MYRGEGEEEEEEEADMTSVGSRGGRQKTTTMDTVDRREKG